MNYFTLLNSVNVNENTEKKGNLTYLSWAWAWAELKKRFPQSYYTIYENSDGWNYFTDGKTAWVKTGVTVVTDEGELEHVEYLPVMDYKNKSIPLDNITSFDVNKTIQRSLTKAVARHGLGLYVYAGEDLPEGESASKTEELITMNQVKNMYDMLNELGKDSGVVFKKYGVYVEQMTKENYLDFCNGFKTWKEKQEKGE